jgi:outer membrane lipoprotein-sorting protein
MAFNQVTADAVCAILEDGKSLRAACKELSISPVTILDWSKANSSFAEQYTRAREVGYKLLADEIIDIADEKEVEVRYDGEDTTLDLSPTAIARNRLRVDTRKWMLSKMLPKIYGDKLELSGDADKPLQTVTRIELVALK